MDERVKALVEELASAKVAQAEAFIRARELDVAGRPATIEDARMGSRMVLASKKVRDPEVIRIFLSVALKEAGIASYPPQDG